MIEGGEVLLTMAQLAVGLAGFSGVVTAFSRTRNFPPADRVRFLMVVGGSFFVILLSLVPFLLELGGSTDSGTWRWSSGVWLLDVVGWPYAPGPVPFLLGLVVGLVGSGSIFVYLVLIRREPGESAGADADDDG